MHQSLAHEYQDIQDLSRRKTRPEFKPDLLAYHVALARCLEEVTESLDTEEVDLGNSLGRVIREDQVSRVCIPPWNRSVMDGFAVKTADVRWASYEAPVILEVIDEVPAGSLSRKTVRPGQAIRIMTGACVPEGADAVIKLEQTRTTHQNNVEVFEPVGENPYIIPAGQDMTPGSTAAYAGTTVNPTLMGVLAGCGINRIRVSKKPGMAIIPTGSELIHPGRPLKPGHIYDINSHALYGFCLSSGAVPENVGIIKDKSDDLLCAIQTNLNKDIILLSGGISVGDYDIVHETLVRAGVCEIFWRVKIMPGKPLFFGKLGKTLVFALPGNPVSSVVNFHLFVRPLIDKLLGKRRWGLETTTAKITSNRIIQPGRRKFLRGKIQRENSCMNVEVISEQRSGIFSPMLQADVLIEIPEHVKVLKGGDNVRVHIL